MGPVLLVLGILCVSAVAGELIYRWANFEAPFRRR